MARPQLLSSFRKLQKFCSKHKPKTFIKNCQAPGHVDVLVNERADISARNVAKILAEQRQLEHSPYRYEKTSVGSSEAEMDGKVATTKP